MAIFPDDVSEFVRAAGPAPTELQQEMEAYGRERDFPLIGPEVGGLLTLFARMVRARHVFEFGSGFGYSATWFLRGLPEDGEVVLTEVEADLVETGREFLERAGETGRIAYEAGDALSAIERHDGPFEVVFIDYQKGRYLDAFEAVAEKVAPGGVVIADNVMRGPYDFEDVHAGVAGDGGDFDGLTQGIVDYLRRVRDAPDFESTVIPVGTGVALSHRDV